jgi:hypothetical protein
VRSRGISLSHLRKTAKNLPGFLKIFENIFARHKGYGGKTKTVTGTADINPGLEPISNR